jgi:hypothetical protein
MLCVWPKAKLGRLATALAQNRTAAQLSGKLLPGQTKYKEVSFSGMILDAQPVGPRQPLDPTGCAILRGKSMERNMPINARTAQKPYQLMRIKGSDGKRYNVRDRASGNKVGSIEAVNEKHWNLTLFGEERKLKSKAKAFGTVRGVFASRVMVNRAFEGTKA